MFVIRLSRPPRLVAAAITLFSILFMQLAVAAYACPMLAVQHGNQVEHMSVNTPDEMQAYHEMDPVQPSLCDAYHQADSQSLDKPAVPPLAPFLAIGFGLPLLPLDVAFRPESVFGDPPFLTRTTSSSLAIRIAVSVSDPPACQVCRRRAPRIGDVVHCILGGSTFIPHTEPVPARHRARRHGALLVLAIFVATFCAGAAAADRPLTLQEAQVRAVERSRFLAANDHSVHASWEQAIAAKRLPDPVLKLGLDNLPVEGPDRFSTTCDFTTQRRVGLMQDLTRADKRRWRAERFEREADKTSAEKTAAAAAIERDTAVALLERYFFEAKAGLVAEQEQ